MDVRLNIGLLGVRHPNMPGDDKGAYVKAMDEMGKLSNEFDFNLIKILELLVSEDDAVKARKKMESNLVDFTMIFNSSLGYGRILLPLAKINSNIGLWSIPEPTKSGVLQLNSFCGLNMYGAILSNYLGKYDIPFKWFYGYSNSKMFLERFKITLKVMKAIKILRLSRIGLVGGIADGFENFNFDETLLEKRFGTYIQRRHTVEDIVNRAKNMEKNKINEDMKLFLSQGKWNKERVSEGELEKSSRVYLAFKEFAEENNYNALAISCWSKFQEVYDIAVCSAMARLQEDGIVAPCEGDVPGAVNMLILSALSGQRPTINDLVSIDEDDETINMWHCGVAPMSLANKAGVSWDEHFNIGAYENGKWNGKGVVADLTFKPGKVTIFRMDSTFDNFFIMNGDVLENKESYYGSSGWIKNIKIIGEKVSMPDLINSIILNKVDHHYPMVYGDFKNELIEFAHWNKLNVLKPRPYKPYL